jgi:tetratricopeptide (TPR) repeat protein
VVLVVPCPVLVGRAAELNALVAGLDAARRGCGGLVFLTGEAGIGKSRLVHEISTIAGERRLLVMRGRAVPGSSTSAFRPLAEALAALDVDVALRTDELQPWVPALAGLVPTVRPTGAELTAPVRGEAVIRLLRSLCASRGGLLVLEDLHWADPETVAIVEHLSDHLDRAPVLCVATARSEEQSPARDLARRLAAHRSAQVLELARLNDAQIAAMVDGCTGGTTGEAVDRVVELADGVPFLAEELLVSPGLPASFADGVAARLARLPEPVRRVLVTGAAFGRHFEWTLLSDATGLAEADVVDALDRGVGAQLLAVTGEGFRFRHAMTAEAVFRSVIPPRRRAIAAAALAALDRAHPEPPDALRDVAARLAERAGEPERAGRLFLAAGDEALAQGALHTAVAALERAWHLLESDPEQDRAAMRLVEALSLAGRVDDAHAVGGKVVDRLPPAAAAAVQLRLAGAAITAARWEAAGRQLAEARRRIEEEESAALRPSWPCAKGSWPSARARPSAPRSGPMPPWTGPASKGWPSRMRGPAAAGAVRASLLPRGSRGLVPPGSGRGRGPRPGVVATAGAARDRHDRPARPLRGRRAGRSPTAVGGAGRDGHSGDPGHRDRRRLRERSRPRRRDTARPPGGAPRHRTRTRVGGRVRMAPRCRRGSAAR